MKNQKFENTSRHKSDSGESAKTFKSLILLLFCAFLFSSCEEKHVEKDAGLIARAGDDQKVRVTETVTLDGTGSDSKNETVSFQWEILRKPVNSTATLIGATTANPKFAADASGDYEIQLTISSATATSSDKVVVTANQSQPLIIDRDITAATILEDRITSPDFPDYIVSKDVAVKSQLILHPGVVIAFARDARLTISDNGGVLVAKGTADKKIRLVGQQPVKGFWTGIMLNSASSANAIEFVEILHAGSQPMLDNSKMALAMFIESQTSVKNCLISQNDGYGLFAQEGAILREFSSNTFTNNASAPIKLSADNVSKLDMASVFTGGNGRNVVEIVGAYIGSSNAKEEVNWKGFSDKTPYRLLNSLTVRTGWKINPGVTVETANEQRIIINEEAYLIAKGTATDKIKFTGTSTNAATWEGILCHSKNQQNIIEFAEISNGGSGALVSGGQANLALYGDNASIAVRNAKITGSGGYGIFVGYHSKINNDFEKSTVFSGNVAGDIKNDN